VQSEVFVVGSLHPFLFQSLLLSPHSSKFSRFLDPLFTCQCFPHDPLHSVDLSLVCCPVPLPLAVDLHFVLNIRFPHPLASLSIFPYVILYPFSSSVCFVSVASFAVAPSRLIYQHVARIILLSPHRIRRALVFPSDLAPNQYVLRSVLEFSKRNYHHTIIVHTYPSSCCLICSSIK